MTCASLRPRLGGSDRIARLAWALTLLAHGPGAARAEPTPAPEAVKPSAAQKSGEPATVAEPAPASAPTPQPAAGDEDTQVARALFVQGLERMDAERWEEAMDCFRRVLAIRWSAAAAHNLGSALVEVGRLVEASEQLRLALRDAQADPGVHEAAQRMLDAIEPQIGKLKVRFKGGGEGVDVILDGRTLPSAALDGAIRIDPGRHVIVARRGGTYTTRQDIFLGTGAPRAMEIEIDASPPPPEFELAEPAALLPRAVVSAPAAPSSPSSQPAPVPMRAEDAQSARDTHAVGPWWLWLAGGVAVTGAVTAALVMVFAHESSAPSPIQGDLSPHVLQGQVGVP